MREEFDRRWNQLAQEVLSGMRDWRIQHPVATFAEIEEELDKRMARMRAGLLEDLAMASAAASVGGSESKDPQRCPMCEGVRASTREAGAQVDDAWRPSGASQAQLWLLPHL